MGEAHTGLRERHIIGADTRERLVSARAHPSLALYGIALTGVSEARPPFGFTRPRPGMAQALVCLSGTGEAWRDGAWVACPPGTANLTPPGVPHAYRAVDRSAAWTVCWVTYGPPGGARSPGPFTPPPFLDLAAARLVPADGEPLAQAILGLYREAMRGLSDAPDPALLDDWARLVHGYARRIAAAAEGEGTNAAPADRRLRRLWEAVAADPAHPWDGDELATRAGMSGEHLRRLCRAELGVSPMRHVTDLRMRHAAALLASGFYTVAEVAEQVGYDNPFAFSTAFRRCLGAPPSTYRPAGK
jgi:AraC-like DNA-binding protein